MQPAPPTIGSWSQMASRTVALTKMTVNATIRNCWIWWRGRRFWGYIRGRFVWLSIMLNEHFTDFPCKYRAFSTLWSVVFLLSLLMLGFVWKLDRFGSSFVVFILLWGDGHPASKITSKLLVWILIHLYEISIVQPFLSSMTPVLIPSRIE